MPGISALTASLGSDNDADSFRRLEQSAKSKKTSEMPRGTGTTDEVRMVNCYIEEKDEEEVRLKNSSSSFGMKRNFSEISVKVSNI